MYAFINRKCCNNCNILNWTIGDIKWVDVKTKNLLICQRMHYPKVDVDLLYVPRSDGSANKS